jgi:transcriptional regulator with XRE-family HTH domain
MDMRISSALIRQEREKRAWSQEHLAEVTGLALRTIQRIEATGSASYESAGAIAAVFGLAVAALRDEGVEPATPRSWKWSLWHRMITLLGCAVAAALFTPPDFRKTIAVALTLWLGCELAIRTRRGYQRANPS